MSGGPHIELNPHAFREAMSALHAAIPSLVNGDLSRICRATILAYVVVARDGTFANAGWRARTLAQMAVGQTMRRPSEEAKRQWDSAKKTARKIMLEPTANWKLETLPDGAVQITRVINGVKLHNQGRPRTSVAKRLAVMRVGDVIVLPSFNRKHKLEVHNKEAARHLMAAPFAVWAAKHTIDGLRVVRTR